MPRQGQHFSSESRWSDWSCTDELTLHFKWPQTSPTVPERVHHKKSSRKKKVCLLFRIRIMFHSAPLPELHHNLTTPTTIYSLWCCRVFVWLFDTFFLPLLLQSFTKLHLVDLFPQHPRFVWWRKDTWCSFISRSKRSNIEDDIWCYFEGFDFRKAGPCGGPEARSLNDDNWVKTCPLSSLSVSDRTGGCWRCRSLENSKRRFKKFTRGSRSRERDASVDCWFGLIQLNTHTTSKKKKLVPVRYKHACTLFN